MITIPLPSKHTVVHSLTKKFMLLSSFIFAIVFTSSAQGTVTRSDEATEMIQPRRLIDAHTAGILPRAHYDFECRIYPSGNGGANGCGLQLGIAVGITNRFNIGISYGGDGVIGRGRKIDANPYPGGLIKYRLIEESYHFPAIALGYDHQGFGGVEEGDYNGYVYKSQGIFLAFSKNYLFFNNLQIGANGAVNFSLENIKEVNWPNGYLGLDIGLNNELAIALEYDLALNSRDKNRPGHYANPFKGFLNLGLRWAFSNNFYLEFDMKDVLENNISGKVDSFGDVHYKPIGWSRELKLVYLNSF